MSNSLGGINAAARENYRQGALEALRLCQSNPKDLGGIYGRHLQTIKYGRLTTCGNIPPKRSERMRMVPSQVSFVGEAQRSCGAVMALSGVVREIRNSPEKSKDQIIQDLISCHEADAGSSDATSPKGLDVLGNEANALQTINALSSEILLDSENSDERTSRARNKALGVAAAATTLPTLAAFGGVVLKALAEFKIDG